MEELFAAMLAETIDRVSATMDVAAESERAPWRFMNCWLALSRFANSGADPADLARARADFAALPENFPSRAMLAQLLVLAWLPYAIEGEREEFPPICALTEIANGSTTPFPSWPATYAVVRAHALALASIDGEAGFRPRAALAEVDEYVRMAAHSPDHARLVGLSRQIILSSVAASRDMDIGTATKMAEETAVLMEGISDDPAVLLQVEAITQMGLDMPGLMRGDPVATREAWSNMEKFVARMAPQDPMRRQFEEALRFHEATNSMYQEGGTGGMRTQDGRRVVPMPAEHQAALRAMAQDGSQFDAVRALSIGALVGAEASLNTPEGLDSAVELAHRALSRSPAGDPQRAVHLAVAGLAHLARWQNRRRQEDMDTGISLLERGRTAAGTSNPDLWAQCSTALAHAYQDSGRRRRAHTMGLSGLRGHAWNVLLQATAADAQGTALRASEQAREVFEMCIRDGDTESAARALEMGRGLILYAATQTRDVASRLADAGETRLAQQWREATGGGVGVGGPDAVPGQLRRQAIAVLAGVTLTDDGTLVTTPGQATTSLLDPPGLAEIRTALGAVGMDALVYLVPGNDGSGAAVVIPAAGPPSWKPLPALNEQGLAGFERFLTERARGALRDLAPAPNHSAEPTPRTATVDEIGAWAWKAAIGPLLNLLPHPADRPLRVTLIPTRELTRVPWHAAWREVDGQPRYAVQDAVFSYAASARMLCESARRSESLITGAGLIVGDPDTSGHGADLPAARAEAQAVKECFYPAARHLGRRTDGSAAPDGIGYRGQVTDWLAHAQPGAILHLACHSVVRAGAGLAETSFLLLAGGGRLAAEDFVKALPVLVSASSGAGVGSRAGAGTGLALAVLASCSSAESGRGYDEAFSLATTMLANNTRSVVSALWSVPDTATSVLMFMFHHFLRSENLRPVDALRAAQLWMITDRTVPPNMPAALRRLLPRDGSVETEAWAAFVHAGR